MKPFTTTKNHYRKCVRIFAQRRKDSLNHESTDEQSRFTKEFSISDIIQSVLNTNNGEKERINKI